MASHIFRMARESVTNGLTYINTLADINDAAEACALLDKKYPKCVHIVLSDATLRRD